jgi:DNA-binding GntR family transcriptional regulator
MTMSSVPAAGKKAIVDGLADPLREAILSGELATGSWLRQERLAAQRGVSRTPVREALARLRDERLVAIVPQLGTYVTLISHQGVADAAFVREALECSAIRLATDRATERELEELQANLAAQDRAEASGDTEAFDRLDEALHRTLCELSGREIAWSLSRRANGHLDRVRRLSLPEPGYLGEMVAEHRAVVAAVAEHDRDAAESALRHHLRMVLSSLPSIRAAHPDYFDEA